MKNLILSLLLIEMILLPSANYSIGGSKAYSTDSVDSEEQSCSKGQVFDTGLNRCVLSKQTVEDKTNARNCEGLEDEEYKECFNKNVENEMAEAESNGEVKGQSEPEKKYGIPLIVTLGSAYVLYTKKDTLGNCSSTSTWLMLGGGVSSLLGEFMAQSSYKKKLKGMSQEYKDKMSDKPLNEDETVQSINENQLIAFDFQIEQEKAREEAHEARSKSYTLAMGLYTASTVAALYEAFTSTGSDGCSAFMNKDFHKTDLLIVADSSNFKPYSYLETLTSMEIIEIIKRKISNFPFKSANAADAGFMSMIGKSAGAAGSGIKTAVKSPYGRAAMSGILALYSKKVADDAGELADEASERVTLLEELKANFEANGGAGFGVCSKEDRESTSSPACYCFLSDGSRDPSKKNSGICNAVYGEASKLSKTDYGKNNEVSKQGLKGCFTKTKQFDPECKCKNRKNKNGGDDCLRINGKLKLGALGSVNGLKDMMKDTVAFTQGDISTAQLNSAGTEDLALRLNKAKLKLAKNPKYKKQIEKMSLAQKKLKKQLRGLVKRGLSDGSITNPFGGGLNAAAPPISPKDVMKNMKNTLKRNKSKFKKGGTISSGKKKPSMADYDFGGGSKGSAGVSVEDIDGVMKKEYSFNDINENPDNNIFKIITNRYQRSGLRRLFDENGISKADDASETDINAR